MKSKIWFSLLAELDQPSFAYLKGNINFAIYSLKLVTVAPRWSGKMPSGFIILMVKEGTVVNVLGVLWVSRAPLEEEAPSPSWMWLSAGPTRCGWAGTGSQARRMGGACTHRKPTQERDVNMRGFAGVCGGLLGVGVGVECRRKAAAVKEIAESRHAQFLKGFGFFLTLLCCLFCLAFDHYWKVRNSCHRS